MSSAEFAIRHAEAADVDLAVSSDERELIQLAASDAHAVASLYRRHHCAIARYIRRRVGSNEDTEDLVAETFMAMVKNLPKYQVRGAPFRAWLYRLASTQVNRWVRRNRRRIVSLSEHQIIPLAAGSTEQQVDDVEQIRVALLALPPRLQTVLALYYMEGQSVAEIAGVLKCAVGTVKSRLARGREQLRLRLNECGECDD